MSDVQSKINDLIKNNKVVVFMKGSPESPMCGFSAQTIQVLRAVGAPIFGVDVLSDPTIRQGIKDFTSWPTIPQIFINGEFVGGCDIITEMFQRGDLKKSIDALQA